MGFVTLLLLWTISQNGSRQRHLKTRLPLALPAIQINYQGREFVNSVSSELHRPTGTEQRVTSAYHPQANGLVERNNRTIQNSLLKVLNQKPEGWPDALPGVLFAYNTSRHKSTRYTPFFLLYGRDAVLPVQVSNQSRPKTL